MNRLHPAVFFLSTCMLLLMAGCSSDPAAELPGTVPAAASEKATAVQIQTVTAQDLAEQITLPGSLAAWEDLTLAAEIAGPIDWVGPQEGDALAAGAAILTIDSVSQKANLARDRVAAEVRKKAMERLESLVAENLVSRQEFDNSVSSYETARQQYELSRIALEKSNVRSPVAGVLDARMVERGEYVKAGDPVALVVQINRLKALIDIPEKDVRYFHIDEVVSVVQAQIDTGEEVRRSGTLVHLAYKADPVTRTYRGKIEIDNRDHQLRPGMIVRIEALRREIKEAIAIPLYAVVDFEGRKVVFLEEAGKASLRPVEVDRVIGDQAVIGAGLAPGERLIVKGQQLLADGTTVKVEDK